MLTKKDVSELELDGINADYSDREVRTKVWRILDRVKESHGFTHEGEKLLIQFYPSRDGGAELFVTKLARLPRGGERAMSKTESVTMLDLRPRIYKFERLDELIRAARIIKDRDSIGRSELFFSEGDGYYLNVAERGASRFGHICEFAILSEFATAIPKERYPYITEHYKKLADGNAIELLSRL